MTSALSCSSCCQGRGDLNRDVQVRTQSALGPGFADARSSPWEQAAEEDQSAEQLKRIADRLELLAYSSSERFQNGQDKSEAKKETTKDEKTASDDPEKAAIQEVIKTADMQDSVGSLSTRCESSSGSKEAEADQEAQKESSPDSSTETKCADSAAPVKKTLQPSDRHLIQLEAKELDRLRKKFQLEVKAGKARSDVNSPNVDEMVNGSVEDDAAKLPVGDDVYEEPSLDQEQQKKFLKTLKDLGHDKESVLMEYSSMPDNYRADLELFYTAVAVTGDVLEHAAATIQADRQVIKRAVQINWSVLRNVHKEFHSDAEVVCSALSKSGYALQYASESMRGHRDFAEAAVSLNGGALQFTTDALKKDRVVVLSAVKNSGWALKYAHPLLQSYKDICLYAVQQTGLALMYVPEALKNDRDVVLTAVRSNGDALKYASYIFKSDHDVVVAAVEQNGAALKHAITHAQRDKEIVCCAVRSCGLALQYASDELRADKEVALLAVHQTPRALRYVSASLQKDHDLLEAAGFVSSKRCMCSQRKYRSPCNHKSLSETFVPSVTHIPSDPDWPEKRKAREASLRRCCQPALPEAETLEEKVEDRAPPVGVA